MEGVDGTDGIMELARENDGVRGIMELARDRDGVCGRSSSGEGGARVHPKRDVRTAISDGCTSEAGGDDLESSVVGVGGCSSPEMDGVGRMTGKSVERREFICVEVCSAFSILFYHV